MTLRRLLGRTGVITGATSALLLLSSTAASAHHCYIPMYSLEGPQSENWIVYTLESATAEFEPELELCDAQVAAGYEAVKEAGLPVGIKIFAKMTLGYGMQDKGKGAENNPNGADGVGLEYFGAGSTLADEALGMFIEVAVQTPCD